MSKKQASTALKSDVLKARFDPATLARVQALVGDGSLSEFVRSAVCEHLDRLEKAATKEPVEPEPVPAMVDFEPLLAAIRDASAATLEVHKGGFGASSRRLDESRAHMARLEQMIRWMASVIGLIARQVGLKDIPVPPAPNQNTAAPRPPQAAPPIPASPSSPVPVPAKQGRKPSNN